MDRPRGGIGSALAEALRAASEGSGRLVLLLGEAGIGKTTTARGLATSARRSGVSVRWSACWSGGGTVAHAPWLALLSGLGPAARRAMDGLLGSGAGDAVAAASARASAYSSVVAALEEATSERPALLVMDDLQWADEGTLLLLDMVSAHLPGLPALIVGTYRDTDIPAGSALTRLGGRADHLSLRGLDELGVAALLGEQLGATRGAELTDDVIRLTAGNPFLVVQIGRLLAEDPAAVGRGSLPTGARDLLQQRLGALDNDERAVLTAAAVLGTAFRARDLEQVVGRPATQVAAALERAAAARIVERAPGTGTWAFAHDLLRLAALNGAGAVRIAELHRSAAHVLQRADAEAAVIAAHLLAGGDPGVDAAAWSVRAGDRALAAMAWEEASGHHARALAALTREDDHDVRADALAGLGRARLLAGDGHGAARAFEELAELARRIGSAALLARAALGFSADLSGFEVRLFDQRQIDLLEEAARALVALPEPGLRSTVLARLSVALSLTAPDARRLELAESALALAREAGEPIVLARALAAHCDAIAGPGHVDRREAEASEIIAIAEAGADGPLELLGRRLRYVARLERGNAAGVEEDTSAFARRAEAIGNPLYCWYVPLWRAQLAVVAGDVDGAEGLIDQAEVLSRAAGSTNGPMLATVLRIAVLWQRGDYVGAVASAESFDEVSPALAGYVSGIGSFAWAYAQAGRTVEARALLDRARAIGIAEQVLDAEWLANMNNLARAAAALNHPVLPETIALLEPYADLVAFEGIGAGLYGSVARAVALGCAALDRIDDALRYAEQALRINRAFGGFLTAESLRTLADCTARSGADPAKVDALHAAADAAFATIGARHRARSTPAGAVAVPPTSVNELRREGDVWHIAYRGTSTIVRHSKGLTDLAVLLARPGREVHVTELEGVSGPLISGGGEALDRRAIAAYKGRLADLAEELDDADSAHDLVRAERARTEYDALVEQLSSSLGIAGRTRAAGPELVERLRKAVSARVRDAVRHIATSHPVLGRHLDNAVRTGTYCSYHPEAPTVWRCR